jgi:hypothetical protein
VGCLYPLVLPLNNRSHVRPQILLECRLTDVLSGVFATLAFGEPRVFVHAGNGGLYVGPNVGASAIHRPTHRIALRETANLTSSSAAPSAQRRQVNAPQQKRKYS